MMIKMIDIDGINTDTEPPRARADSAYCREAQNGAAETPIAAMRWAYSEGAIYAMQLLDQAARPSPCPHVCGPSAPIRGATDCRHFRRSPEISRHGISTRRRAIAIFTPTNTPSPNFTGDKNKLRRCGRNVTTRCLASFALCRQRVAADATGRHDNGFFVAGYTILRHGPPPAWR